MKWILGDGKSLPFASAATGLDRIAIRTSIDNLYRGTKLTRNMNRHSLNREFLIPDLSELLKPYKSGWVALSADQTRVVASAETLHDAREQASNRFAPDAVFVKVIPPTINPIHG